MGEVAFAAPILPGKLETFKEFIKELDGPRLADYAASRERHGITRERVYH